MIGRRVLLLTTLLVLATGQSPSLASPADISTTRAYIHANYALVQFAAARLRTAEASLQGVLGKVRRTCPQAAAGSPQSPESTMLSNEIIGAMVIAAYSNSRSQITAFIRVAAGLRWSSGSLSRAIHSYAGNLRTLTTLAPPDLCRDVRAWVASGYTKLPASTVSFDQRFMPAWVALGLLPRQLAPFERADERGVLKRSGQLEDEVTNFEAAAVQTYADVMNALGVSP